MKEVGGLNIPVSLYGLHPASGTFVFFREMVVKGEYSQAMRQMAGNAQIIDAVAQDISGIGYVGLGYAKEGKGIKIVKIAQNERSPYLSPLGEKELSNYPIARPLYQYTNGKPKGAIKELIEFILSDAGQEIVEEVGFQRLPEPMKREVLAKMR